MIKILSLLTFFTTVLSHRITSDSIICFESTSSYLNILTPNQLQQYSWASIILAKPNSFLIPDFHLRFTNEFEPVGLVQTKVFGKVQNGIIIYQTSPIPRNTLAMVEYGDNSIIRLQSPFLFTLHPASKLDVYDVDSQLIIATHQTQAISIQISKFNSQTLVILSNISTNKLLLFESNTFKPSIDISEYLQSADQFLLFQDILAVLHLESLLVYKIRLEQQTFELELLWKGDLPFELLESNVAKLPLQVYQPARSRVVCVVGHSPAYLVTIEPPSVQTKLVKFVSQEVDFVALYDTKLYQFKVEPNGQSVSYSEHVEDDESKQQNKKRTNYIQMLCLAIGISLALLLVSSLITFKIYKKRRRERIQSQKSDLSRRKELDERIIKSKCIGDKVCSICCEELKKKGILTHCKHAFHRECLYQWVLTHTSCPLCRKQLVQLK